MLQSLKPADAISVARKLVGQDLDRHIALQLHVARAIDLAHSAATYESRYFYRAELCANCECQSDSF